MAARGGILLSHVSSAGADLVHGASQFAVESLSRLCIRAQAIHFIPGSFVRINVNQFGCCNRRGLDGGSDLLLAVRVAVGVGVTRGAAALFFSPSAFQRHTSKCGGKGERREGTTSVSGGVDAGPVCHVRFSIRAWAGGEEGCACDCGVSENAPAVAKHNSAPARIRHPETPREIINASRFCRRALNLPNSADRFSPDGPCMRLDRPLDVIGVALFQLVRFQGFVREATRRRPVFDAARFRYHGDMIHVVAQVRKGRADGSKVKIRTLLREFVGLGTIGLRPCLPEQPPSARRKPPPR